MKYKVGEDIYFKDVRYGGMYSGNYSIVSITNDGLYYISNGQRNFDVHEEDISKI